jgi:hypothetical protein
MTHRDSSRIVAFELRSIRIGFAVLEGSHLLDWGARAFRGGVNTVSVPVGPKVGQLLDRYEPTIVVLKRNVSIRAAHIAQEVHKEARSRRIPIRRLSSCAAVPGRNKHERAMVLARQFPELLSSLPPKRKIWQNEHYRMPVFEAVAVGFAYLSRPVTNLSNGPWG